MAGNVLHRAAVGVEGGGERTKDLQGVPYLVKHMLEAALAQVTSPVRVVRVGECQHPRHGACSDAEVPGESRGAVS